jgi:hypothetical protein
MQASPHKKSKNQNIPSLRINLLKIFFAFIKFLQYSGFSGTFNRLLTWGELTSIHVPTGPVPDLPMHPAKDNDNHLWEIEDNDNHLCEFEDNDNHLCEF